MKLQQLGANRTLLVLNSGLEIFFSYETPVAGFAGKYFRTDKNFSVTTSRHINEYLAGIKAETVTQDFIEELLNGIGEPS